ncbi:MAG TPA: aspartyl protease family protein [Terracidiphilus sp.]
MITFARIVLFTYLSSLILGQRVGAQDVRFPNDVAFVRLPMEIRANGPYVKVKANGQGPFVFEVDTGSMTSPIARELARQMGSVESDGTPKRILDFTLADGFNVPVPLDFASFAPLWPLTGRRIYGVLGYGILKHFVVEFDYEGGYLTLYDPKQYRYSGVGVSFPASLEMGYDPQIEGKIVITNGEGVPVHFTLDTGAGGTVVSAPIVKAHNLLKILTTKVPDPRAKPLIDGVDGQVFETTTARIDAIRLGNLVIDNPLVALSTDTDGVFAMEDIGVNLGGNILRRFKLIVDYPGNRVILEPNQHFHETFSADASGLVLEADGPQFKRFLVHGVVRGSPAEKAGLQEGDVITAIDGETTNKYALWEIQDLLKESGKTKRLTINRHGQTTIVALRLHALV